jgi:hypothetical protein
MKIVKEHFRFSTSPHIGQALSKKIEILFGRSQEQKRFSDCFNSTSQNMPNNRQALASRRRVSCRL